MHDVRVRNARQTAARKKGIRAKVRRYRIRCTMLTARQFGIDGNELHLELGVVFPSDVGAGPPARPARRHNGDLGL